MGRLRRDRLPVVVLRVLAEVRRRVGPVPAGTRVLAGLEPVGVRVLAGSEPVGTPVLAGLRGRVDRRVGPMRVLAVRRPPGLVGTAIQVLVGLAAPVSVVAWVWVARVVELSVRALVVPGWLGRALLLAVLGRRVGRSPYRNSLVR
ncbi:hypothetical protein GCM10009741_44110 [Kribbella lupini]|uniref:Uncharacterized protein n=1 Tax=Kribbella lupini TaxID=291602 RepID=A0ABP4M352_9ACTN